ncbi:hypothetical protein B0H14DRAFT_3879650 [Mycena olivaceomarginata]|nr:hypothetical protein B0H14DRAFT_3879650 [Mycena olivaceomarginata]
MKSEEKDEDKGRARRDHEEDALPIHAPSCESVWSLGSKDANSEEGESQLSLACSSSPSLPRRRTPAPPSLLCERRGSGTPRSGWGLRAGFGYYSLSLEYGPGVGDDTHKHTALCLRPGPFSLLLAVGTPADRRAAETAKARSRIATPSSRPDSAVQRISDAVVAHLRLCSLPRPLLHTIGGGMTIPSPTKTDDTGGRKPACIGTHFDGAEARRLSGSGRRGREALNGARQGGGTLRSEWAVR